MFGVRSAVALHFRLLLLFSLTKVRLLQINGQSLLGVKHATAVDIFVSAGEQVELRVWHGAEKHLVVSVLNVFEKLLLRSS